VSLPTFQYNETEKKSFLSSVQHLSDTAVGEPDENKYYYSELVPTWSFEYGAVPVPKQLNLPGI